MTDEEEKILRAEVKRCNERGIRLEEHDKGQDKELGEQMQLISELYDYKNDTYQKIAVIREETVRRKEFQTLKTCVTELKVSRKFLPWAVMVLAGLASVGTLVLVFWKVPT